MKKSLFLVLNTFAILNTILASYRIALIRRGQNGDVSYYINNVAQIPKDLMKNNQPKEDCVFYVNSLNSTREKNAAIAFAEIRNAQLAASGASRTANTLYDAFDLDVAFGNGGTLMREAEAGGEAFRRTYFKVTSGEYAKLCRGTVWLIVRKDVRTIYHDAIWLTHEYPQLIRPNSGVREIFEIDPAEIEAALALNDLDRNLHPTPYRGGMPPGNRPPRSIDPITYHPSSKAAIEVKINQYSRYPDVADGYTKPQGTVTPKCDMSDSSQVPYNVFNGVFGQFCKNTQNNPLSSLTQIVDSKGNVIPPKKRSLSKRTPPPNPDSYKDYKFSLSWSGGKGACHLGCQDAFNAATASPCGHTGGQQNIMSTSGTIEAGCGQYKWQVIIPPGAKPAPSPSPSPPKVSAVKCNAADAFGKHGDINPGFQKQYSGFACAGSALKSIKPGDPDITYERVTNGTPYKFKISWLPKCKSTVSQMNVYLPLPSDPSSNCLSLLLKAYTDCNNGGVGGSIDVGCVRYEFHP